MLLPCGKLGRALRCDCGLASAPHLRCTFLAPDMATGDVFGFVEPITCNIYDMDRQSNVVISVLGFSPKLQSFFSMRVLHGTLRLWVNIPSFIHSLKQNSIDNSCRKQANRTFYPREHRKRSNGSWTLQLTDLLMPNRAIIYDVTRPS